MSKIPTGNTCMIVGCSSLVKSRSLCAMHYARWQRHGNTSDPAQDKRTCTVDGCDNEHAAKGLCANHYYKLQRTGSVHGVTKEDKHCSVEGCDKPHRAGGFCEVHYRRKRKHGHVVQTRPADWGSREKHPLYSTWIHLTRHYSRVLCNEWLDFWVFVNDISERPTDKHVLRRLDDSLPFGAENVYWKTPRVITSTDEERAQRTEYMKQWRTNNPDRAIDVEMRKRYGITLDDYNGMFADQDGVCVICQKTETRVDHRTKTISRLAVDHDHNTGKVRGLLCHACNVALGLFKDDRQLMQRASEYLRQSLDETDTAHPS